MAKIKGPDKSRKVTRTGLTKTESGEVPEISIHFNAKPTVLKPLDDDKREGPRYKCNFEAVVYQEGTAFRTRLLNISLVGVLLKEPIPENFVKKPLSVMIIHTVFGKRETLLIKAEALGAPLRSPRIRFTELPETEKVKLEALFKKLPPG